MDSHVEKNHPVRPDLVRRTRGGWLAVAPQGARFSIAVTADTHEEAQEKFCFVYNRWVEILSQGALDVPKMLSNLYDVLGDKLGDYARDKQLTRDS